MTVFMSVDFECVDGDGTWIAFSAIVAEYPTGKQLDCITLACERQESEYAESTMAFWKKHPSQLKILKTLGDGHQAADQEVKICDFVAGVLEKHPSVFVLSDNPQLDIRLLDNMLVQNGKTCISDRKDKYFQCLCTWSYRQGVQAVLKKKPPPIRTDRDVDAYFGPRHTPQADCAQILSEHFRTLDLIKRNRCTTPKTRR